jgi:hypothetical protein
MVTLALMKFPLLTGAVAGVEDKSMLKPCCGVLPLVVMVCSVGLVAPGPAQESAKTPEQEDVERIADLVLANHILVNQGVLDAFGHISVRSAKNPNHYFISRSRAPALVSADDIM